jgi:hypothetical protein
MTNELPIVSFETAKLLNKAGFDWRTEFIYLPDGKCQLIKETIPFSYEIPAPTQALAQMWFREVHNIQIIIHFDFYQKKNIYEITVSIKTKQIYYSSKIDFKTYEEALEFGIQKACEHLIKQKK